MKNKDNFVYQQGEFQESVPSVLEENINWSHDCQTIHYV